MVYINEDELKTIISNIPFFFHIEKELDPGGQKRVFSGKNIKTGQELVLKIVKTTSDSKERTLREIRATTLINHPRVPKILATNANSNLNENEDTVWLVEPYIPGCSLRQSLNHHQKLNIHQVIYFIESMLSILGVCEKNKIIHRDIKPENIMVDEIGEYWLIDFGISRHLDLESITQTNSPFGPCTIGYAAGEQFRNRKREIDIRADLFSIGVIAAEMVCGYNPYIHNTQDILQVIKNIENQPLPMLRIEGDESFYLARLIKSFGDNRISRRPRHVQEAKELLEIVKKSIIEGN